MNFTTFRQRLKPWMLPIAMLTGIVLHNQMEHVAFLSKYFIFVMLLITYCRVKPRELKPVGATWWLLLAQFAGSVGLYFLLCPVNEDIAQCVFICIYCPTATAAPIITGMLGGKVGRVATFSLMSHVIVAVSAPLLLSMMNPEAGNSFMESVTKIGLNVLPLILGPLLIAFALDMFAPKVHDSIANHQGLSFYIWAISLLIVVGSSVSFVMKEPPEEIPTIITMTLASLGACVGQFALGRWIGSRYGDRISGAQSLGQKNTVLGIWLAMTFLPPIVSVGPAAYVAWHNTINSWQIYRHEKNNHQ